MENIDYTSLWKKVESFQNRGLPESALKVVDEIYALAKGDNNAGQFVKAVIFILKYTEYKEEAAFVKNLSRLETELKTAVFPVKPVLHTMLAELYWHYYQSNRYIFSQRTETSNFDNNDIATWSLEKIISETIRHYLLSLDDAENLKNTPVDVYVDILYSGNTTGRAYRPTLYDFLAHRAVDFFMGDEPGLTKPAYSFTIHSADYLANAHNYTKLNIATTDTFSYKYHALRIFQELLRFHLGNENPDALVDIDLKRLHFVNRHLTLPDKQQLYLEALEYLEEHTIHSPVSAKVTHAISRAWAEKGRQYKPLQSDKHKWDIKKAYDICETALIRFPESDGAKMAYNFQQELLNKTLSAQIEKVNIPRTPFRAMVTYKNFTDLHWRIIPVEREEIKAERDRLASEYSIDREEKFLEYFLLKRAVASGKVTLPDDGDMQPHSVEIKLDGVPEGDYMVLFSNSPRFSISKNVLCYAFTTISNLAYIHRNLQNGSTEFYVLNRTTGDPVPGAKLQLFFNQYNSNKNRYEILSGSNFTANENGFVEVTFQNKMASNYYRQSFFVDIWLKKDRISTRNIDSYGYSYEEYVSQYVYQKPKTQQKTFFFLDRAIYRPGQTLYFKGLVVNTDEKNPKIVTNRTYTLSFYDVNHQVVTKQQVTTNEYGTFSGNFTTPSSGLTGQMYLAINDGVRSTVYFSVEEYKRPKFEVSFEAVKGSYRLGETIHVSGKASAYSGANIDGAGVNYRVVRQARFPRWWWFWYGYYPSSPEIEISNGNTLTDVEGNFTINFLAIPDESVDKKSDPVFSYTVYADVTDINGETRSGQTTINAGYRALDLSVNISDIDKADPKKLKQKYTIASNNLSGEFEAASGSIKIWKLKSPEKAFRNRLWERPDRYVITQDEHARYFPDDLYADENNFYMWAKESEVFSSHFNTAKEKEFGIEKLKSWEPGKYMMEITAHDKFGQEVKEQAWFDILNSGSKALAMPVITRFTGIKTEGEPGEIALLSVESSEKINALFEVEHNGKIIQSKRVLIQNEKQRLEIPLKEEYRGNISAHYTLIKNNRWYNETAVITVPYTNKQLDIHFETFRDKLQPGEQEEWRLKITGKNAEKVVSEMVATLYDASLDVFRPHGWNASFYQSNYARLQWQSVNSFNCYGFRNFEKGWNQPGTRYYQSPAYDALNWFGLNLYGGYMYAVDDLEEIVVIGYGTASATRSAPGLKKASAVAMDMDMSLPGEVLSETALEESGILPEPQKIDFGDIQIRKDFNETAFFYPHLKTDEQGSIIISFTIPEALTRWKMLGFAHTQELKSGMVSNELVTQKELMVVPNQPRFFRENDKMMFSAKITSLVDKDLSGEARLEFFDALTMNPVELIAGKNNEQKTFAIAANQSTNLEWPIAIPEGLQAVTYRIVAKAGNYSDGEEMIIPVVTNRMLVTETLPLPIRGRQTKTFTFEKLANNTSPTLTNHRFTLEFTSNPAWYAIQALPYLMEFPFECTEQIFARFYANSIASHIANSNPKIKQVFDIWKNIQPDALLSNLEKNQELKSALLEETPWVLHAKDESQRKRNVALLFDLNRMANEQERALKKIARAQTGNGGFSWFPGFPEDAYITQHIVAGMGHLDALGVRSVRDDNRTWNMLQRAVGYIDLKIQQRYEYLKSLERKGELKMTDYTLNYSEIHYLYARSYFKDVRVSVRNSEAFTYFLGQSKKYWLKEVLYMQGMIALALHRYGEKDIPQAIIQSLTERALHSEEMGMYWKYERGYYWYQAPIETHALMVEVFDEISGDQAIVEELKIWLLKQKQVQDWRTTKATSEACYALLRRGTNILASDVSVEITVGNEVIDPSKRDDIKVEAGTGYFKTSWTAPEITPEMGTIQIHKKDEGIAWGAAYWQYFEQLDKITPAETPLRLNKKLFLQQNTNRGPVIVPVDNKTVLKTGDLIKVRIELRVDRTMEYIHMKDMRAAGFEPTETLSTYKYQDGLHYYQSTRDLATHFFIGWLPKGTYVFEYPLRVSQKGDFSNGITTIQCMYAPEFSSHSEGVRVVIE